MKTRCRNVPALVLALAITSAVSATGARAQAPAPQPVPAPIIPDILQRSGMVMRQTPIIPHLPPDPKRDQWYDSRWGDEPNLSKRPNWYRNGGLYGLPWKADHTASYYPYFFGSPGQNTLKPNDHHIGPMTRFVRSFATQFKPQPIGMYYEQGSFAPVYDLDPLVPGPGAAPYVFPFYRRLTSAGG